MTPTLSQVLKDGGVQAAWNPLNLISLDIVRRTDTSHTANQTYKSPLDVTIEVVRTRFTVKQYIELVHRWGIAHLYRLANVVFVINHRCDSHYASVVNKYDGSCRAVGFMHV